MGVTARRRLGDFVNSECGDATGSNYTRREDEPNTTRPIGERRGTA
jgi:hypothetical protein